MFFLEVEQVAPVVKRSTTMIGMPPKMVGPHCRTCLERDSAPAVEQSSTQMSHSRSYQLVEAQQQNLEAPRDMSGVMMLHLTLGV